MNKEIYREVKASKYSEEIKGKNYITSIAVSEVSITHFNNKGPSTQYEEVKVKLSLRSSPESQDTTWHIKVAFANDETIKMLKRLMIRKTKIIVWEGYNLGENGKNIGQGIFDGYDRQVQKILIVE